jgi:cytochrome b
MQPEMSSSIDGAAAPVRVWDPVVRLFHWTVVVCCLLAGFVFDDGKSIHQTIGWVAMAALAIRIVWGFVGTRHARFSDFVPGPRRLFLYLAALIRGRESRHIGHNPAAAVMILALMALLAATGVTGWMLTLDAFFGEVWLEALHEAITTSIFLLVGVHVAAAIWESLRHRENLILAMITGTKRA